MKKIGLIYNATRSSNLDFAKKIGEYLSGKGITTCIYKTGVPDSDLVHLSEHLDFALILGGDGTLLGTSRVLAPKNIPMFGVNTGHLGFLTEGRPGNVHELLDKVLAGEYRVEERAMLEAQISSSDKCMIALNDIVIYRAVDKRMLHLTLSVNERPVADYHSDGLIISTPTGSTAYAMAAGGAVMDPEVRGIEIVPMCAHSLTNRPHIVSDTKELTITFNRAHQGTILQMDGQENYPIKAHESVKVKKSKVNAKLIRLLGEESDFYWTIRQKFHWGSLAVQDIT
jgi:NAD+ kinase